MDNLPPTITQFVPAPPTEEKKVKRGQVVNMCLIVHGSEKSGRYRAALFDGTDVANIRRLAVAQGMDTILVPSYVVDTMEDPIKQGRIIASTGKLQVPLVNRGVWQPLEEQVNGRKRA